MATDIGELLIKISADLKSLNTGLKEGKQQLSQFKDYTESFGSSLKKALAFTGLAVGIYEIAMALKEFGKNAAMVGARTETLQIAMDKIGETYGVSRASLKYYVDELKGAGITTQESMQAVSKFLTSGLPLEQLKSLATRARDIAVVAGVNTSEALSRIVQGIITGEQETLRRMMIQVGSQEEIYKRYAASLGTTADKLNSVQKAHAMLNEVMRLSVGFAGVAAEADASVGKQMASMARFAEEAKNSLWALFGPIMLEAVQSMTDGWKQLKAWAEANQATLRSWGESIADWISRKLELIAVIGEFIAKNKELIFVILQFLAFYKVAGYVLAFSTALTTATTTMAAATTTAKGLQTILLGLSKTAWVIVISLTFLGLSHLRDIQRWLDEATGGISPETLKERQQRSTAGYSKEGVPPMLFPAGTPQEVIDKAKKDWLEENRRQQAAKALEEGRKALEKASSEAPKPIGKEGKGKGKAGAEEDLYGEYLRMLEQKRQADLQDSQNSLELLRATNEKKKAEYARDLAAGLMDGQTYYQRLQELQQTETAAALTLIEKKKIAQTQAYQDALADLGRQELSSEAAEYRRQTLEAQNRMQMAQLAAEAARVKYEGEAKVTQELKRQVETQKQYQQKTEDLNIETEKLFGNITEKEATLQKLYLEWQRAKQEAMAAEVDTTAYQQALERNYQAKKWDTEYGSTLSGISSSINSGFSSMVNSVVTGTNNFGSALNSMFSSIINAVLEPGFKQLQAWIQKALQYLWESVSSAQGSSGGGFWGSVFSAIGSVAGVISGSGVDVNAAGSFASGSSISLADTFAAAVPMAAGGILTRPTLALAGEAGAEAFVPLSGGAIPVSLTGGMKSQVHNYNINIQALDARSVRDLFNENPELILGVTEKSARNFRYSRRNRT